LAPHVGGAPDGHITPRVAAGDDRHGPRLRVGLQVRRSDWLIGVGFMVIAAFWGLVIWLVLTGALLIGRG
jgi:hypothetical protein